MTEKQKKQTQHFLNEFIRLSNKFSDEGDKTLAEYWKGQVMGICKMITVFDCETDLNPTYFLNQLY
jgi:hypothetical protein